jgi:hypothetical protein
MRCTVLAWEYSMNFNETQISETNNLKVTIGALKFDGRNEAQISKAKRIEI